MATNIASKREIKSILPKPYSSCIVDQGKDTQFDSDLFNKIKNARDILITLIKQDFR